MKKFSLLVFVICMFAGAAVTFANGPAPAPAPPPPKPCSGCHGS
jgi:hypothetical protein